MPEISEFQPGLPSWADLSTPDVDESRSFYGELLGWEAKEHTGADVVSEPGAVAWHPVNTRDPEKAREFYEAVFGWNCESPETGGREYWEWQLEGGKSVGGMFLMED